MKPPLPTSISELVNWPSIGGTELHLLIPLGVANLHLSNSPEWLISELIVYHRDLWALEEDDPWVDAAERIEVPSNFRER